MRKADIELRKTDTIFDEIDRLQQQISARAYDLFCSREGFCGGAIDDWLQAERELVFTPPVELRQTNGRFEIVAALPGVDAKDVDVRVTPEDVLIKTAVTHEHKSEGETVHVCELESRKAFRSIHLPEKIDPDSVKAEYRDGLLRLTAAVAGKAASPTAGIRAA
jgi:HSP20 family protein